MRILSVVHHTNAAEGVFADSLAAAGAELAEWIPHESPPPSLDNLDGAIVFGADSQVDQEDRLPWLRAEKDLVRGLLDRSIPVLGVCFGSQLLAEAAGGGARRAAASEIGWYEVELTAEGAEDSLLGVLPERFPAFQYHHYEWLLPQNCTALARSEACLQAFRVDGRPAWGVQFHPEITAPDLGSWLDTWHEDQDAVATGLDPEAIRAESEKRIGEWNALGRRLSERFLALAGGRYSGVT